MIPAEWHFLRPGWLWLLLPLGFLLWRLVRVRERGEAWQNLVDPHLLQHLLQDTGGRWRRLPVILLGLGWLLSILALAGPTWKRLPQSTYQAQQYLVVLLNISQSMNTNDLPPSRLTHARYEVLDLLRRSEDGQVALLAFGAEPYVVTPLTSDVETIASQVPSLETELLPVDGAARIDLALQEAGKLLQQAGAAEGQVILMTDDVNDPGAAVESASRLVKLGYRVSVMRIGTVAAQSDERALRALAESGDGIYVTARAGEQDLNKLLPDRSDRGAATAARKDDISADQWREEGPWLLLLLLPLAALAFRRGWISPLLLVCVVPWPTPGHAFTWQDLWQTPDQQALQQFREGRVEQAAKLFKRQDWQAAAQYAAENYQQALAALADMEGNNAVYNRGNALAHLGRLEEAITAYDEVLTIDPDNVDARHNRDLVRRLLQQQQTQPQQHESESEQPDMSATGSNGEQPEQSSQQTSQEQSAEQSEQSAGDAQQAGNSSTAQEQGDASTGDREDDTQSGEPEEASSASQQGEQSQESESPQAQKSPQNALGESASEGDEPGEQVQQELSNASPDPEKNSLTDQQAGDERLHAGANGDPGMEDLLGGDVPRNQQWSEGAPGRPSDPESEQAVQQMLRMVEDDPTGLLRQRFLLQHLRRQGRLP